MSIRTCRPWRRSSPTWIGSGRMGFGSPRSEEHTSELQSQSNLVCRLLLEKKKNNTRTNNSQAHSGIVSTPIAPELDPPQFNNEPVSYELNRHVHLIVSCVANVI